MRREDRYSKKTKGGAKIFISLMPGYRLVFKKAIFWNGKRWRSKIDGWDYARIDGAHLLPRSVKKPPGEWQLLEFRHSTRNGRQTIIGAYYVRREGNAIKVTYREIVSRGC